MKIDKGSLEVFFQAWLNDSIKDLDGKKLVFPDDWPEDHAEKSADYFCEHFGIESHE